MSIVHKKLSLIADKSESLHLIMGQLPPPPIIQVIDTGKSMSRFQDYHLSTHGMFKYGRINKVLHYFLITLFGKTRPENLKDAFRFPPLAI